MWAERRHGASVGIGLIVRGRERLEATRSEIEQAGGRTLVLSLDVAAAEEIEKAADRVEAELGAIDIWVNNAMTSVFSPVERMTVEEFKQVTDVTYLSRLRDALSSEAHALKGTEAQLFRLGRRSHIAVFRCNRHTARPSMLSLDSQIPFVAS